MTTVGPNLHLILWTSATLLAVVLLGWVLGRWMRRDTRVVLGSAVVGLVAAGLVVAFGILGAVAVSVGVLFAVVLAIARSGTASRHA